MDDVILDPVAALPRLAPLRSALSAHDWAAVRRVVEEASAVERTLLLLAADPAEPEGFLGHLLGADPADSLAAALLADHRVDAAWAVRTGANSDQVSSSQFAVFHDGLRRAEWVLLEATARRPDDPTLWVQRLMTARGLQLGVAESRRRYDRLAALDPDHLPGQRELLQTLCPKWAGSWPVAFAFARECAAAARPGTLAPVLVAEVHLEQFAHLRIHDRPASEGYLQTEEVRAEVRQAAERSVWHPDFVPGPGWVRSLNTFAAVFSEQGDRAAAADVFARLGPLATAAPWDYFTRDPVSLIREARAQAFAGASR